MSRKGYGGPSLRDGNVPRGPTVPLDDAHVQRAARLWRGSSHFRRAVLVLIADGCFNGSATAHVAGLEWQLLGVPMQRRIADGLRQFLETCNNA